MPPNPAPQGAPAPESQGMVSGTLEFRVSLAGDQRTWTVVARPTDTVGALLERVSRKVDLTLDDIRVIYKQQIISNWPREQTLAAAGIVDAGAVLSVVRRARLPAAATRQRSSSMGGGQHTPSQQNRSASASGARGTPLGGFPGFIAGAYPPGPVTLLTTSLPVGTPSSDPDPPSGLATFFRLLGSTPERPERPTPAAVEHADSRSPEHPAPSRGTAHTSPHPPPRLTTDPGPTTDDSPARRRPRASEGQNSVSSAQTGPAPAPRPLPAESQSPSTSQSGQFANALTDSLVGAMMQMFGTDTNVTSFTLNLDPSAASPTTSVTSGTVGAATGAPRASGAPEVPSLPTVDGDVHAGAPGSASTNTRPNRSGNPVGSSSGSLPGGAELPVARARTDRPLQVLPEGSQPVPLPRRGSVRAVRALTPDIRVPRPRTRRAPIADAVLVQEPPDPRIYVQYPGSESDWSTDSTDSFEPATRRPASRAGRSARRRVVLPYGQAALGQHHQRYPPWMPSWLPLWMRRRLHRDIVDLDTLRMLRDAGNTSASRNTVSRLRRGNRFNRVPTDHMEQLEPADRATDYAADHFVEQPIGAAAVLTPQCQDDLLPGPRSLTAPPTTGDGAGAADGARGVERVDRPGSTETRPQAFRGTLTTAEQNLDNLLTIFVRMGILSRNLSMLSRSCSNVAALAHALVSRTDPEVGHEHFLLMIRLMEISNRLRRVFPGVRDISRDIDALILESLIGGASRTSGAHESGSSRDSRDPRDLRNSRDPRDLSNPGNPSDAHNPINPHNSSSGEPQSLHDPRSPPGPITPHPVSEETRDVCQNAMVQLLEDRMHSRPRRVPARPRPGSSGSSAPSSPERRREREPASPGPFKPQKQDSMPQNILDVFREIFSASPRSHHSRQPTEHTTPTPPGETQLSDPGDHSGAADLVRKDYAPSPGRETGPE